MIRVLTAGPLAEVVAPLVTQPGLCLVGAVTSWTAAGRTALERRPDVALVDVATDAVMGLHLTATVARRCPVLVLTEPARPSIITRAARAGASGYLVHGRVDRSELGHAVRVVHAGGGYIAPAVAPTLLQLVGVDPPGEPAGSDSDLTAREYEIMTLIARGLSNSDIAAMLHISPKTVKNHINRAYTKLEVADRRQAIRVWSGVA